MRGAVAVAGVAGPVAAVDRFPGRRAGQRGGVDQAQLVPPGRGAGGQVSHERGQQRPGLTHPFVVAVLVWDVREHAAQVLVGIPQPVPLRRVAQQDLHDGQADQLRMGQQWAAAPTAGPGNQIVDLHVKCGHEGVQISVHEGLQ